MINFETFFYQIKLLNKNNNNNYFYNYTRNFINSWFVLLNSQDKEVLYELTFFLYARICNLFIIDNEDSIYQFTKNNNQDLKALVLLLLPFLMDEDTNIYNKIFDLNQILCYKNNAKYIDKRILEEKRPNIIKEYFKYSNFAVGLLNDHNKQSNKLLDLYPNNEKLIWTMIHHNFMSLLETLNQINGKLYINWINITPITIKNYRNSTIYNITLNTIKGAIDNITNNQNNFDYIGLYIGEFYNVFRNIFYESMKQIKWLIFPYSNNTTKQYIIQYIDNLFSLEYIYASNIELPSNIKSKFINSEFKGYEYEIWKTIIVFMVNNYSAKNVIDITIKKPFMFKIEDEPLDDDYKTKVTNEMENITIDDINIFLKKVNDRDLIDFFKESIDELKSTFYSKFLFDDIDNNKLVKGFPVIYKELNLKNFYNIAKTLSHNTKDNKFELLPKKYSSLSEEERIIFFEKYTGDLSEWLKIRKNLEKENSRSLSQNEYNTYIQEIFDSWDYINFDIVFDYLAWAGILSEFKVDKNFNFDIANNRKRKEEEMKKKFNNNKDWEDTNYYLTNNKFSEIKYSEIDEKTNKDIKKFTYFEYLTKKTQCYTFYAMDWLAQINFFNHYLNNRVMFVTGSTGTGKSTQVPKLLLYSLKSLDYKQSGKVVNTQPRITPTIENADRIASELGVQLKAPNADFNNEQTKTTNYQVQFKYQNDNHTKQSCPHLTLKISTDGTLFEEIVKNPLIKEQVYSKDKKSFIYGGKNKYDIIIIDESHEHNINMDLLITLLRNSAYYNNDVKVVIVSATLEEDEPIYRSYFKYINDNLLYPIKAETNHLLFNEPFLIDSIYLDRRFHISPPGKGTQYEIKENYLPSSIVSLENTEKRNSQITQEKSYEIINKICLESTKGDILLFANGQGEIIKAVEALNKMLPSNVIALPYFSELHEKYKEIVVKINNKINFIKTKRQDVAKTWTSEFIEDLSVQNNIYTRAVIIATNVAEASITIDSLRYVVDNGYAKVNNYDNDIDLVQLNEEEISEASRKQRKGRVGRTSNGSVYYVYEKGAREKVQPKFKITQANYEQYVIKLMCKSIELIIEPEYDPNNYNILINKIEESQEKILTDKTNILSIILHQYKQNDKKYWNELYFNYTQDIFKRFKCHLDGFELENILDTQCIFYIIHPYEDKIVRNILHNPIEINGKKIDKFNENVFNKLLSRLENKLLLVNIKPSRNIASSSNFNITYGNYYITELVEQINNLTRLIFVEDFNQALLILYAQAYGVLYEVIQILTLIKLCNYSITSLFINQKLFTNQDNQIEFLFNLIQNIKKNFSDLQIFNILDYNYLMKKYFSKYIELARTFKKNKDNKKKNIGFTYKLYDKFNDLDENGELYTKKGFEQILNIQSIITIELYSEIDKNKLKINKWEEQNNLKVDIVYDFLTDYAKNLVDVLTIQKDDDIKFDNIDPLTFIKKYESQFLKTLNTNNIFDRILKPFIHAYPLNFGININDNQFYLTTNSVKIINVETELNTLPYLFYFYFDNFTNKEVLFKKRKVPIINNVYEIRLTNKIDISMLFSALPFYYKPSKFRTEYLSREDDDIINKSNVISIKNQKWQLLCNKIANAWKNEPLPFENATELEILSKYIKNIKIELLYE
jgi:hypothetical protein